MHARRRNDSVLRWARAALFVAIIWWSLSLLQLTPGVAIPVLSSAIGLLALLSPGLAVLASVAALSLPLLAADIVTGLALLVIGFASIQYLAQGRGEVFLLLVSAILLAWAGPAWAAAAIAGLILGSSEGAINALVACVAVQMAALVAGAERAGVVVSGATAPGPLALADSQATTLTFAWLGPGISEFSPEPLIAVFTQASLIPLLLLQPLAWAAGAATVGLVRRTRESERPRPWLGPVAVAIAVMVTATLHSALLNLFDSAPPGPELVTAAASSLILAVAFALVWEYVFPPLPCAPGRRSASISAEDADVDELLTLIARAEDELANKHTTEATVLISDMKSFSAMTEEDGSVTSAKAIQRHRDLLLPLIEAAGGRGKSTGGDGLVAAFNDSAAAVDAAIHMQQALRNHHRANPSEREIGVRIGIASGEVVLDRGGRPFIGAALNRAARVMNLGDGGQILISRAGSPGTRYPGARIASHGSFELKNIAEPVPIDEVIWADDQQPRPPRCT